MRLIPVTSASETQLNSKKGNTTMCEIKSLNVNQEEKNYSQANNNNNNNRDINES